MAGENVRPPSRIGRKAVMAWLEPEQRERLNIEVLRAKTTVQAVLEDAVTDWLRRRDLAEQRRNERLMRRQDQNAARTPR